jgi:uncharacterized membrane protein
VAIAAGVTLSVYRGWFTPFAAAIVGGYLWTVVCLHYHSAMDVLSTGAVILPMAVVCYLRWMKKAR